jgi:hypothetical protein
MGSLSHCIVERQAQDRQPTQKTLRSRPSIPGPPDDHLAWTHFDDQEGSMKYLCLFYIEEKRITALPKSEFDALVGEHAAYDEELRKSGHFITSAPLQPAHTAMIVRVRNGKLSTTDGPFAETKEQLGGFDLIEARDLNDAVRIASKFPPARLGTVEVRALAELSRP